MACRLAAVLSGDGLRFPVDVVSIGEGAESVVSSSIPWDDGDRRCSCDSILTNRASHAAF